MADRNLTEKAIEYVRALFRDNADGHGADHTLRVYRNAMRIADSEPGCDRELVALAALLHDADDHKLFRTENNANARAFLRENGIPEDQANRICEVINAVSFSQNRGRVPETPEGQIVQDADRLDALGAVGIARTFAYGGKHSRPLEGSVQHFYDKLLLLKDLMNTESGKQLAEGRHAFLEAFLQELEEELGEAQVAEPMAGSPAAYKEQFMDRFADERDLALLEGDRYTFFVLRRILGGSCTLLLTDHERLIICFTAHPYPVWIWTSDGAAEEEFERAYRLCAENGLLDGTHTFNLKYELAEYFLRRAVEDRLSLKLNQNMFAYDCPAPVKPAGKADGALHRCTDEDFDELVEFIDLFHRAVGIDKKDREAYCADARAAIESGRMFFWQNAEGKNVACCKYGPNGSMASVNLVFTRSECRRMHYAENMVYQVTCLAQAEGYLPMLYTNADYAPSNACYEKIGYVLRGKLCTIG